MDTMVVDANTLFILKNAIISRFSKELVYLQIGHPYKRNKVLQQAIDLVDFLEHSCPNKNYNGLVNTMIRRLHSDYN